LKNFDLRWFDEPALTVVMAAKGYPGDYAKGTRIGGLDEAAGVEGVEIFHAGTIAKDGDILANGGRVLNICATGRTVTEAQQRAYQAVDRIHWPEGFAAATSVWQAVERGKGGLVIVVDSSFRGDAKHRTRNPDTEALGANNLQIPGSR